MELLYENLSTEQRDMLRSLGYFEVIGGETGRRYRIRSAYRMNIEEIGARGTRMCLMCFSPNGRVGLGDIMLAQKLALELFEPDALAVANVAPYEFEVIRRLDNRCRTALRGRS
jgi:hypothetical protein